MTNSLVRFGTFTDDGLNASSQEADALSGSNYVSLDVGDTALRFMPPPEGKNSPFRITAIHYVKSPSDPEKSLVFACPRVELKAPCAVCARAQQLSKEPNPVVRQEAKDLECKMRILANVMNRSNPSAGVRILGFGKSIFDQLKSLRRNPRLGGDYTNPLSDGFDVVITRTGTGKNDTKYIVSADRNTSPLAATVEEMQELIDNQHDLDAEVVAVVPEQLVAAFGGHAVLPRGGERVGSKLMTERSTPAAPAKSVVADAEFEDDFLDA